MNHQFAHQTGSGFLNVGLGARASTFAVAGVAWDGATTNRPGARFGPRAMREASRMLCDATHTLWDCAPQGDLCDVGDLALPNTSLVSLHAALQEAAQPLIAAHHMCWLGGDHSITLALLRAYRAYFGCPLALIHFDAHCDTWRDHAGEPSGHGTWLFEALEEKLVDPESCIQIGIRSPGARADRELVADRGGMIFDARGLRGLDGRRALGPVIERIRERVAGPDAAPLYLTLDIDCLDPAFAPGTGTPETAGLTTSQVATILEELVDAPFVGMDLVEVAPPYDHSELTAQAGAFLVWTYLCARIAQRSSGAIS